MSVIIFWPFSWSKYESVRRSERPRGDGPLHTGQLDTNTGMQNTQTLTEDRKGEEGEGASEVVLGLLDIDAVCLTDAHTGFLKSHLRSHNMHF